MTCPDATPDPTKQEAGPGTILPRIDSESGVSRHPKFDGLHEHSLDVHSHCDATVMS